ncbi:MAG: serine hydrolase family protein [Candidatus Micrarchaeota archaeon]|nr:serine hydrolase family protein [Candidatus Micrarchaeota archaeon]
MPNVFIVHGWGGDSECDWIPWLKEELQKRGVNATAPDMPNTNVPKIEEWVPFLSTAAANADEHTYFVGHSIGCQTVVRYLAGLPEGKRVGGAVLVAGYRDITDQLSTPEEKEIMRPWKETPIDWEKAKAHAGSFTCIVSDDDPYVPVNEAREFGIALGANIIMDNGRGHFSDDDDVTALPSLLYALLNMMGMPEMEPLI